MSLEYVTPDKGPGAPLNLEFWTYFFFGEGPKTPNFPSSNSELAK